MSRTAGEVLSLKEALFVEAYLKLRHGTKAALEAGYSARTATVAGSKLLSRVKVRAAIDARLAVVQAQVEATTTVTLVRLIEELARIALVDPKDLFGPDGRLLKIADMPEDVRRAVQSLEFETKHSTDGTGEHTVLTDARTGKLRFWDKPGAIRLIAQLAGYLREKVDHEHTGEITYRWKREGDE